MGNGLIGLGVAAGVVALGGMIYVGTYNGFQRKNEVVSASERQIASCYQKRSDLITNLEATVSKYAAHEKDTNLGVAQARAGSSVKLPDNATPEQIKAFVEAQQASQGVMARLTAVAEAVPNLKADQNFARMQRDLRDTENQCNILRNRYIDHIRAYNVSITSFPSNIVAGMHGYTKKDQIKFEDEKENAKSPRVFKQ